MDPSLGTSALARMEVSTQRIFSTESLNSPIYQVADTGDIECKPLTNAARYLRGMFVNYTKAYVQNVLQPALKEAFAKQPVFPADIETRRHRKS